MVDWIDLDRHCLGCDFVYERGRERERERERDRQTDRFAYMTLFLYCDMYMMLPIALAGGLGDGQLRTGEQTNEALALSASPFQVGLNFHPPSSLSFSTRVHMYTHINKHTCSHVYTHQ